jgi:hypothetical protein
MGAEKNNLLLNEFSILVKQLSQDVSVNAIRLELGEALLTIKDNNDSHHSNVKLRLEDIITHANDIYSKIYTRIEDISNENESIMLAWKTGNQQAIGIVQNSLQTAESLINKHINDHTELMQTTSNRLQTTNDFFAKEAFDFKEYLNDSSFQQRMSELETLNESIKNSAKCLGDIVGTNQETAIQLGVRQRELQEGLNKYMDIFKKLKEFMQKTELENQDFRQKIANYQNSMVQGYENGTKAITQNLHDLAISVHNENAVLTNKMVDASKKNDINMANLIQSLLEHKTSTSENLTQTTQQLERIQNDLSMLSPSIISSIPKILRTMESIEKARGNDQLIIISTLVLLAIYIASHFFF